MPYLEILYIYRVSFEFINPTAYNAFTMHRESNYDFTNCFPLFPQFTVLARHSLGLLGISYLTALCLPTELPLFHMFTMDCKQI